MDYQSCKAALRIKTFRRDDPLSVLASSFFPSARSGRTHPWKARIGEVGALNETESEFVIESVSLRAKGRQCQSALVPWCNCCKIASEAHLRKSFDSSIGPLNNNSPLSNNSHYHA